MTAPERILVVGASLAGLRATEALRVGGFRGGLTIVGDEPHLPYDRPPLSKQSLSGMIDANRTSLPRLAGFDARWRLGTAAIGLDLEQREVALADGSRERFDQLLVATGTRARPWPQRDEARLDGVMMLRTREDASALRAALVARPRRVVVIGGGFTGSEIASTCREQDIPVTLVEHNETPLATALGLTVGRAAAALQRAHGVDLRCGTAVERIEGDASGRVRGVRLAGGELVEGEVVVVALGSLPNVEWLAGSGLAAGPRGLACDAGCRAFDAYGIATDDVYAAGDVARFPHPLFNFEFMTLEHWGNAVAMAQVAAHNMLGTQGTRRPHVGVPSFWSSQFDVSIKSVGVPPAAEAVVVVQGAIERGSFVAAYGRRGRVVAAVAFDGGKWLDNYAEMVAQGAPFPPPPGMDAPSGREAMPADFPRSSGHGLDAFITLSGHVPGEARPVLHREPRLATGRDREGNR